MYRTASTLHAPTQTSPPSEIPLDHALVENVAALPESAKTLMRQTIHKFQDPAKPDLSVKEAFKRLTRKPQ